MRTGSYYHGGVPGKQPGDRIVPAAHLGLDYSTAYSWAPGTLPQVPRYRPDLVYFTTHLGVARGYAARYMNSQSEAEPGDVYRVVVPGPIEPDPDFDHPRTGGIYGTSRTPVTVEAVVQRGVALTLRQQNEVAWPYRMFYANFEEIHDQDGTVLASTEMRLHGATDEYLRLLPKWMDASEFGNGGRLWSPGRPGGSWATPDEVLDIVDHLALDTGPHLISGNNIRVARFVERDSGTPILFGTLQCRECSARFADPTGRLSRQHVLDAAVHQAGPNLRVIAQFNGGLDGYLPALRRRHPARWTWTATPTP